MKVDLVKMGAYCKQWRIKHGYTQGQIARDTHYSIENISVFERGGNDNLRIFVWYVNHGMSVVDMYTEVC